MEHAIAPTPLTLPSHTSILTGLEPPAHGVRDNGTYRVPEAVETLAERLKAEGYETQAFVSAEVLHSRYNLDQGFDGYDDELWGEGRRSLGSWIWLVPWVARFHDGGRSPFACHVHGRRSLPVGERAHTLVSALASAR